MITNSIKYSIRTGVVFLMAVAFAACSSDDEPFFSVSEDDSPRILNTDFPKENADDPNSAILFSINRDQNLKFEIIATPTAYSTVTWYIDDQLVATGNTINQPVEAGNYTLRIVVTTTKGKETSRTCKLVVKELAGDPVPGTDAAERLVVPGTTAKLHGDNLSKVTKLVINGQQAPATYNSADQCIDYTVPTGLADGAYRISVIDDQNKSYGAGKMMVTNSACLIKTAFAGSSKQNFVLEGKKLNEVNSITIDGKNCVIVSKSAESITLTAPELSVGDYVLKGTTASGQSLKMVKNNQFVETAQFIVANEDVFWMGDWSVSWELPDGNPNKEWKFLSQEKVASFEIGHTLHISLKYDASATYHQYQIDNYSWALLPGQAKTDITQDTVVEIEITTEFKDAVASGGFAIHGHGFNVTRAAYK